MKRPVVGRWLFRLGLAAILSIGFASGRAQAFCGFFVAGGNSKLTNNASQVVLMRKGTRVVMTMSNTYQGPPEDFAMVVPVPVVLNEKDVKTLPPGVFDRVDSLSAPRLVEYWEQDPCRILRPERDFLRSAASGAPAPMMKKSAAKEELGVTIEAQFTVGEYQILILSAKDSKGLETWLQLNKYTIPAGAAEALAPYVRAQSKFFVAKVDIEKTKKNAEGVIQLSPLRFAFESADLRLPVRLGLLNANGKQDLIVYILHPTSRFEVANYQNQFIPTNIEVADLVRHNFAAFFADLFDAAMARAGGKTVMTEYSWQTTSCDPCPTPPLTLNDLATLGLDMIDGKIGPSEGTVLTPATSSAVKSSPPGRPMRLGRPFFGASASWVLTRLHTRYSAETLSEDLVFREARPAMGGRATFDGQAADAGAQVNEGGINNFQGRYIIRHYWEGDVKCNQPRFGVWGGPPNGGTNQPIAAKGLALVKRGTMKLKDVVNTPVPLLELKGRRPPQRRRR